MFNLKILYLYYTIVYIQCSIRTNDS